MSADFNITNNCNSRCITCSLWRQKSYNELTTEEVNEILVQLKEIGIRSVGFAGGEPLLRKDLTQIVEKAKDLKYENIRITTNGLLLTRDRAEDLIENGLKGINISIDGTAETNDSLRGIKNSYERNIRNIAMLTDLRDTMFPNLNITILTTLMKPTLDEVLKMINLAKKLNVDWGMNLLDASPFFFKGVDISELLIEDQNRINDLIRDLHGIKNGKWIIGTEYIRKYFRDPKRSDIPCNLGYLKIYISPNGDVYPGCWVLPPLGNLRENTIKEIITSKKYKQRLYDMFLKKCPGCGCNYQSNLYYHGPSLFNEIKLYIKKNSLWKHYDF